MLSMEHVLTQLLVNPTWGEEEEDAEEEDEEEEGGMSRRWEEEEDEKDDEKDEGEGDGDDRSHPSRPLRVGRSGSLLDAS